MGYTISEKIMARASGNEQVHADDIVWVDIDRAMMDDVLGPRHGPDLDEGAPDQPGGLGRGTA